MDPFEVLHLYLSPDHNFFGHHGQPPGNAPIIEVAQIECVAGHGIRGDRFYREKPGHKGQITFFAIEVFERLRMELGIRDKPPSAFRRNVITRGTPLNDLIGADFEIQGVRFHGVEESRPCEWMDLAFGPGARDALHGNGGLRAQILTSGMVRTRPAPVPAAALSPPSRARRTLDVRPIIARGDEPLGQILDALDRLPPHGTLAVTAPFLPAPLIERLSSEGYRHRLERGVGSWTVHFTRESSIEPPDPTIP